MRVIWVLRIGSVSACTGRAVMWPMSLSSASAAEQAACSAALMPVAVQLGAAPSSVLRVRSSTTNWEALVSVKVGPGAPLATAAVVGLVTSSTK